MRTDSDRNLSAEADPNPARKTRERVLTMFTSSGQATVDEFQIHTNNRIQSDILLSV